MSALPEENTVAADTATTPESDGGGSAEVRNLYAIPRPEPAPETEEEHGRLSRLLEQFQRPRWWSESTPSPAEELNRARHGTHLQATGPMRTLAVGYAWVAGGWNTKDKAKIWVRSHPARLVTVGILLGLLLLSPARPIVAGLLFGLPHLMFELLTG